jgi:hypothetical protein
MLGKGARGRRTFPPSSDPIPQPLLGGWEGSLRQGRGSQASPALPQVSLSNLRQPRQGFFQALFGHGQGQAHVAFAGVAEAEAGHHYDAGVLQHMGG